MDKIGKGIDFQKLEKWGPPRIQEINLPQVKLAHPVPKHILCYISSLARACCITCVTLRHEFRAQKGCAATMGTNFEFKNRLWLLETSIDSFTLERIVFLGLSPVLR